MRALLWLLLLPALASAEIYRWTDANGQVHFGQRRRRQGLKRLKSNRRWSSVIN